jgi:hypothetical protein
MKQGNDELAMAIGGFIEGLKSEREQLVSQIARMTEAGNRLRELASFGECATIEELHAWDAEVKPNVSDQATASAGCQHDR